jgi:uncharacterized protein YuzE
MTKRKVIGFEVSISGCDDGTVEAVYLTFFPDKVHRTREMVEDQLLVDYNKRREIVGIEILSPVKISRITRFVASERRPSFRRFIRQSVPRHFVYS